MSVHEAPAPQMIGKVVAVQHKPRGLEDRLYVGRLAVYRRVNGIISFYFEGSDRKVAELDVQQDTFSFQLYDPKE